MYRLIVLLFLIVPVAVSAQGLNGPNTISGGSSRIFTHSASDTYKYIAYDVYLPSMTVGFIGFKRLSGTGDHDIRIGTGITADTYKRASITGVVASNDTNDSSSDLLVFAADDLSADRFYIEAWSHDNKPGEWRVSYRTFNIPEKAIESALKAAGVMILECMFTNCDANQDAFDRNVGRALTLGMSAMNRSDVCSVGSDLIVNEVMTELEREIGGGQFIITALGFFISDFISAGLSAQC